LDVKLESLKHRRTEADKKFFDDISQPDNCLHHLHVILNSSQDCGTSVASVLLYCILAVFLHLCDFATAD